MTWQLACGDAYMSSAAPQARPLVTGEALAEYIVDVTTEADRHGDAERFADAYDAAQRQQAADQAPVIEQPGTATEEQRRCAVRCSMKGCQAEVVALVMVTVSGTCLLP